MRLSFAERDAWRIRIEKVGGECPCCIPVSSKTKLAKLAKLPALSWAFSHPRLFRKTGVAEPKNIRREFSEAEEAGHIALTVRDAVQPLHSLSRVLACIS